MKKDTVLLSGVSSKFTERTLKEILEKATDKQNIKVNGWTFEPAASKGDNYLSIVHRVTIEGTTADDEIVEIKIIVKGMLQNEGRKKTFRSKDFFSNEIYFYSEIVPMFEDFLRSKNQLDLLPIPRCLAYYTDGKNDFLALEDAKALGYEHTSRKSVWEFEDCLIILKSLAKFHGISLALNDQNPSEFFKISGRLIETLFSEQHWNWYKRFYTSSIDVAKDAMAKEYKNTEEEKKFASITARQFFEKDKSLSSNHQKPSSVVNHGDSWALNFMTRKLKSGEFEAIIFDFQVARCASPVLDISYFIYTSTDKKTRDKHFEDLLKYYYDELTEIVKILGSDINNFYSWNSFMKEVKDQFVHGLRFSLEALPAMMLDDPFDPNIIVNNEAVDIAEIWQLRPIETQAGRKRIADVVMHAIKHGFL